MLVERFVGWFGSMFVWLLGFLAACFECLARWTGDWCERVGYVGWFVAGLLAFVVDRFVGLPAVRSVDGLDGCLFGWLVGWFGWSNRLHG